jgi:hypothetical protein
MNSHNKNRKLDELAERAIGAGELQFDFERWKKEHGDDVREFETSGPEVEGPKREHGTSVWRSLMRNRVLQVGVAAMLILSVLAGLYFLEKGTTSVAWGELGQRVGSVRDFVFKLSSKMTINGQKIDSEIHAYQSEEYGVRMDMFSNGQLQMIMYMPADLSDMVTVMPGAKQYIRMKMTPEYRAQWAKRQQDPRGFVNWFTSVVHTSLGRSVVDGVEVEGIEAKGPNVAAGMFEYAEGKLWVDPVTQWPVRMEIKGKLSQNMGEAEMAMYGFEWDKTLEPSWYTPEIPADYTQQGGTMTIEAPSEETLVKGLRVFAELSGGTYPTSLNMTTVQNEMGSFVKGKFERSDENIEMFKQKFLDVTQAYAFYIKLVSERKEPEYFGKEVTAADTDKVLMRWKSGEGKMKVVYGDLSVEEIAEVNEPVSK